MNLYIPIANKGIAYLNKSELKICFSSILGIFVFWNDIMNLKVDIFLVNKGYSLLWILTYKLVHILGNMKLILLGQKKLFFALSTF